MFVNVCYFIGSVLYVPASILLFWPKLCLPSTVIFIVASLAFVAGGVADIANTCMDAKSSKLDYAIVTIYLFGGIFFALGSFLFLSVDKNVLRAGLWTFRFGSVLYITGSAFFLAATNVCIKRAATIQYMTGSTLFIVGGILSEMRAPVVGFATIWTVGSIAFTGGASFNLFADVVNSYRTRESSHQGPTSPNLVEFVA